MRVVLFADSAVGRFNLCSAADYESPVYCLPVVTYPYDLVCVAKSVAAYQKVDSTVALWKLYKQPEQGEIDESQFLGYCFHTPFEVLDYGNALFVQQRAPTPSRKSGKANRHVNTNLKDEDFERIASNAILLFRTDDFYVFGSSNYGVLITANSNEALDEALSNSI